MYFKEEYLEKILAQAHPILSIPIDLISIVFIVFYYVSIVSNIIEIVSGLGIGQDYWHMTQMRKKGEGTAPPLFN